MLKILKKSITHLHTCVLITLVAYREQANRFGPIGRLQRPVRAIEKRHVGRAQRIPNCEDQTRGNSDQTAGKVQNRSEPRRQTRR